ncbi:MAG: ribosome-binding factor A [bacterium]|nr:ribosome-binding factor A [bacterium]
MPRRIEQLNELLQREIGAIIARDVEFPKGTMVTILSVRTAGDLKNASITVSIFPDNKRGDVLRIVRKKSRHIEMLLQEHIPVHHIPSLLWRIDVTEQKAQEVEKLLDSLQKKE